MSTDLKPGDVCEIVRTDCMQEQLHWLVGLECTVEALAAPTPLMKLFGLKYHGSHFLIALSNGDRGIVCHHCLRKKPPPQGTSTWEAIKRLTNWSPFGVPEPA